MWQPGLGRWPVPPPFHFVRPLAIERRGPTLKICWPYEPRSVDSGERAVRGNNVMMAVSHPVECQARWHMTAHTLVHEEEPRRVSRGQMFQLGWPSFWLLGGILAGMLALVGLVLFGMFGAF